MRTATDKVLIVEDQPDESFAAAELFKSLGYDVLTAGNGVEAINVIEHEEGNINVLFCDVVLTNGVSGINLARTVSKLLPDIQILLCSGYSLPVLREKYGNIDEFAFIDKPYRKAELSRCLSRV